MREDTILPYNDNGERQTKRREQAPALRCTDIFLCIYRKLRICLTIASGYAHTLILISPIRTSPLVALGRFLVNDEHRLKREPQENASCCLEGTSRTLFYANFFVFSAPSQRTFSPKTHNSLDTAVQG